MLQWTEIRHCLWSPPVVNVETGPCEMKCLRICILNPECYGICHGGSINSNQLFALFLFTRQPHKCSFRLMMFLPVTAVKADGSFEPHFNCCGKIIIIIVICHLELKGLNPLQKETYESLMCVRNCSSIYTFLQQLICIFLTYIYCSSSQLPVEI